MGLYVFVQCNNRCHVTVFRETERGSPKRGIIHTKTSRSTPPPLRGALRRCNSGALATASPCSIWGKNSCRRRDTVLIHANRFPIANDR